MSADGAMVPTGGSGNLKPWPKGKSGNSMGFSRVEAQKRKAVKKLALLHSEEAMETIIELMRSSEQDAVRLQAAIEVRNTAVGKPKSRDVTAEEMDELVDKRIRALAQEANEMKRRGALDVTPEAAK